MQASPYAPAENITALLPEPLAALRELAQDLSWTWIPGVRALFAAIDPEMWERAPDNPWLLLKTASADRWRALAADAGYVARVGAAAAERRERLADPGWFGGAHADAAGVHVAYFSAEVGVTECLPLYAGGLGVLAGDHLKSACTLGVPLTGVSLLYGQGFFRQQLTADGWQIERYPCTPIELLPLTEFRRPDGTPLLVQVDLPGRQLDLLVWQARIGAVRLLLLDANLPTNAPADRDITRELYADGREMRIQQEIVLGIGGWRAVLGAGLQPDVLHINEGHAAFAVLERARAYRRQHACSYAEARLATAAGNVFTTHTPLPAAFDAFAPDLVRRYFGDYAQDLGLSLDEFLALGGTAGQDPGGPFHMAALAVRHAGACNGVSQLHGDVSKTLFAPWFPRIPRAEIPVGAVTNGVHAPSWTSPGMAALWAAATEAAGLTRRRALPAGTPEVGAARAPSGGSAAGAGGQAAFASGNARTGVSAATAAGEPAWPASLVPDGDLWAARCRERQALVDFARQRLEAQLRARGAAPADVAQAATVLAPDALTIGFARRFAAYKRPALLLRDPERLRRLLALAQRPVQLIVAGKAHPGDDEGKRLIQAVVAFANEPANRRRVVFLEDDDLHLTRRLVAGVNLWLNTPRRPLEASGTSGMKVLANGGLNLSSRDGWWAEACTPDVGWALPGDLPDDAEAETLYRLLETEVVPAFYQRGADGLPHAWLQRVKASVNELLPRFTSDRMVRQYVEEAYLPCAARFRRLAGTAAGAARLAGWERVLRLAWSHVAFRQVVVEQRGADLSFRAEVFLGEIPLDFVRGQIYADGLGGQPPTIVDMAAEAGGPGACDRFRALVPGARPAGDYTVRIIPHHPDAVWPLTLPLVAWER